MNIIAGFDAIHQSEKIKKNIGYMSQKFSLYEDITVTENIGFYAGIYGLSISQIKEKTNELLNDLDFESSENKLISSLPLRMETKTCLFRCNVHNPKIVFLDEPDQWS